MQRRRRGSLHDAVSAIVYDTKPVLIGADINSGTTGLFVSGSIDEVRLWDAVRPIADIQKDLRSCTPGAPTGLAAYWPLDDGASQVVTDLSGVGNPGQLGSTIGADGQDPTSELSTVVF